MSEQKRFYFGGQNFLPTDIDNIPFASDYSNPPVAFFFNNIACLKPSALGKRFVGSVNISPNRLRTTQPQLAVLNFMFLFGIDKFYVQAIG